MDFMFMLNIYSLNNFKNMFYLSNSEVKHILNLLNNYLKLIFYKIFSPQSVCCLSADNAQQKSNK